MTKYEALIDELTRGGPTAVAYMLVKAKIDAATKVMSVVTPYYTIDEETQQKMINEHIDFLNSEYKEKKND